MPPLSRSTSTSSISTNYLSHLSVTISTKLFPGAPISIHHICYADMTRIYDILKNQYFLPYYSKFPSVCFSPGDLVRLNAINVAISSFDRRPAFDHRALWPFLQVARKCEKWSVEVILAAMLGNRVYCGDDEISAHAESEIEFLVRLQMRLQNEESPVEV